MGYTKSSGPFVSGFASFLDNCFTNVVNVRWAQLPTALRAQGWKSTMVNILLLGIVGTVCPVHMHGASSAFQKLI